MSRSFSTRLLQWFDLHGRKNLPWQQDRSPYRVWVSEIMLQQTQVITVIPYYQRFIERFPDVHALAKANIDEVLHYWTGLGYYARARNLHKTAIEIANKDGQFPNQVDELMALPGIGRSTAGAIKSIAFAQRAAILDGNVKRVLCRHENIRGWPGEKQVEIKLWQIAEALTPRKRVRDYTQAIMDLGATLCLKSQPKCHDCPLSRSCEAHQLGEQQQLPTKKPKKTLSTKRVMMLILQNSDEAVLLFKRPPSGIWGGLWSFPEISEDGAALLNQIKFESTSNRPKTARVANAKLNESVQHDMQTINQSALTTYLHEQFAVHLEKIEIWPMIKHSFTHFRLEITPLFCQVGLAGDSNMVREQDNFDWIQLSLTSKLGTAKPVLQLLDILSERRSLTLA